MQTNFLISNIITELNWVLGLNWMLNYTNNTYKVKIWKLLNANIFYKSYLNNSMSIILFDVIYKIW